MPFEVYEPFSMALSVSFVIPLRPGRESLVLVLVLSDEVCDSNQCVTRAFDTGHDPTAAVHHLPLTQLASNEARDPTTAHIYYSFVSILHANNNIFCDAFLIETKFTF